MCHWYPVISLPGGWEFVEAVKECSESMWKNNFLGFQNISFLYKLVKKIGQLSEMFTHYQINSISLASNDRDDRSGTV